jgi:Flp pilus assembly protein TadD
MKCAPDDAGERVAVIRSSISARPFGSVAGGRRRRGTAIAAVALVGSVLLAGAQAQPAAPSPASGTEPSLAPMQQLPPEAPERPALSVPYDAAIAAYRAGRGDEALMLAERALRTDPRNPQLRFLRGVVLAERGRDDDAVAVFRGLTDDFPELAEPYNNLAVIHARRGDWDAARLAIEQSIRAVPGYALAHENLGDIHLQLASRSYEQAGRLDPRNASAREKLALARELIGRLQPPSPSPRNPRPGAPPQATPP